jgi:hypothetical protein
VPHFSSLCSSPSSSSIIHQSNHIAIHPFIAPITLYINHMSVHYSITHSFNQPINQSSSHHNIDDYPHQHLESRQRNNTKPTSQTHQSIHDLLIYYIIIISESFFPPISVRIIILFLPPISSLFQTYMKPVSLLLPPISIIRSLSLWIDIEWNRIIISNHPHQSYQYLIRLIDSSNAKVNALIFAINFIPSTIWHCSLCHSSSLISLL